MDSSNLSLAGLLANITNIFSLTESALSCSASSGAASLDGAGGGAGSGAGGGGSPAAWPEAGHMLDSLSEGCLALAGGASIFGPLPAAARSHAHLFRSRRRPPRAEAERLRRDVQAELAGGGRRRSVLLEHAAAVRSPLAALKAAGLSALPRLLGLCAQGLCALSEALDATHGGQKDDAALSAKGEGLFSRDEGVEDFPRTAARARP